MQSTWRSKAEAEASRLLEPSGNVIGYGSIAPAAAAQRPVAGREEKMMSWKRIFYKKAKPMSAKDKPMRTISAREVWLPPVKWYKKIRIPGLVASRSQPHSNAIRTTKYTILNFLPKNLWEQFHRWANIYFLFIALINFIPAVEAVGKEVAFLPLLFVLAVTVVKDIFEDYRRFKSDREENNRRCLVYDWGSKTYVLRQWSRVCVGDFIQLKVGDVFPADLLLLQSSDPTGICYIETANIDGETSLKQRQVAPGMFATAEAEPGDTDSGRDAGGGGSKYDPERFQGTVHCEQPHSKIYEFNGYVESPGEDKVGINKSNLLLRGCVLRNTASVLGLVVYAGHETKAMLNNSGPRSKRSKLERSINAEIISQVAILFILCFVGAVVNGVWTERFVDRNVTYFPFTSEDINTALEGFVRFWTFLIIFQVIIPISLYVTIEIVKFIQIYFINWDKEMYYAPTDRPFQCRALNISEDLGQIQYVFSDKTGTLTENQMVFRCCSIGGINYPHTLTEELAKVHTSQNGLVNSQEVEQAATTGVTEEVEVDFRQPPAMSNSQQPDDEVDFPEPPEERVALDPELMSKRCDDATVKDFFTVMAICNSVVVSSSSAAPSSSSSSSNIRNENETTALRSGNQTQEEVDIRYEAESPDEAALVEAARDYGYVLLSRSLKHCSMATPWGEVINYDVLHNLEFDPNRKCMSIIVRQKGHSEVILYSKGADSVVYRNLRKWPSGRTSFQVESGFVEPDIASGESVPVSFEEATATGDAGTAAGGVANASAWRDSSAAAAAAVMMADKTQTHLDDYAKIGLRTLCMAKRVLTEAEYKEWLVERHNAELALENRDELLHSSALSIESELELLGATGIEDKLQTNVPEALASLQAAGMKIWVLTGDKQETAINIGYSSQLIHPTMEVIVLNAYSKEECRAELKKIKCKVTGQQVTEEESQDMLGEPGANVNSALTDLQSKLLRMRVWKKKKKSCDGGHEGEEEDTRRALVVDGPTLKHALDPVLKPLFREVAEKFHSVIGCRATPLQKAAVVDLVKCGLGKMTLAIGDGANDVSMIQKADVGVGIAGKEGMQAVMASDFAMGRFHFLVRLLLVHGHWSYGRLARLILYFFYKNIAFAVLLFWYQIFNAFSGSNPILSVNLFVFNLLYTSLPIIVVGVADQDLRAHILLQKKVLYKEGQCSQVYTRTQFWLTVLDAFYQCAVVFFVAYGAYYTTDVGIIEFGLLLNMSIVIVVSLHLAVETFHWTIAHHVILWGSIVFTFVFNYVYTAIFTMDPMMDPFYVMQRASLRTEFWFVMILTPVIALFPRVLAKVIQQEVWPTPVMTERARRKKQSNEIEVPMDDATLGHQQTTTTTTTTAAATATATTVART